MREEKGEQLKQTGVTEKGKQKRGRGRGDRRRRTGE
jgi:hypothetical protein